MLFVSRDDGLTFEELDSSEVTGKPNLHQHTVDASNFATGGPTFLMKVSAVNVAGTLESSTLPVVLADVPAAPTAGPTYEAS